MTQPHRRDDAESVRALDEEVERAAGHPVPDEVARQTLEEPRPGFLVTLSSSKPLVGITLALAVVVGAIASLALGSWWLLLAAVFVHFMVTFVVVTMALRMASQVEKPDPAAVARMAEAGVDDPEEALNAALRRSTGRPADDPARNVLTENGKDGSAASNDPAEAAARQQVSNTPSSEPTRKVPGEGS